MLTRRLLLCGAGIATIPAVARLPVLGATYKARVYHVAPGGSDAKGTGSIDNPFGTLPHAYGAAEPGDTIVLRGGTYGFRGTASGWLLARRGGKPGRPIQIVNRAGETPVIDGSGIRPAPGRGMAWPSPKDAGGFPLVLWDTPHVVLRGITVRNGPMGGIHVNGAHDGFVIERCVTCDNGWFNDEHGVGLGIYGRGDDNAVRDCDSYGNHGGGPGATGGNADGFQIVLQASHRTVVAGNRAWRNSDDGFDFFVTSPPEDDRSVTGYFVDDNRAFENGCLPDGRFNPDGDGVGFKLGGRRPRSQARHGGHLVTRCIAWGNKTSGFDDNSYNGGVEPLTVFNNTAFDNGFNADGLLRHSGYAFIFQGNARTRLCNNVAFATDVGNALRVTDGLQSHNVSNRTVWNAFSPALALDRNDFMTLDDSDMRLARRQDGSLATSAFLRPSPASHLRGRGTIVGLPRHIAYRRPAPDLGAVQVL